MRLRRNWIALLGATALAAGCAQTPTSPVDTAQAKAATDLACPSDQVTVTSLGDNKYGASGCGRTVAYEIYGPRTLASLRTHR